MKVTVLCFGQFRSARRWFEPNLLELKQAFPVNTEFSVCILTDKLAKGCYSPSLETYIRETLAKYSIQLQFLEFWEDQTSAHTMEHLLLNHYESLAKGKPGYEHGNHFAPANWYRRYILYKLFEESKSLTDYVIFSRLFDTHLEFLKPLQLEPTTLLGSIDSFFVGPPLLMKKLFQFGAFTENWQSFEWTSEFQAEFAEFDAVLAQNKPTFCSEVQIYRYIKRMNIPFKSLRYDFSAPHGQSLSHKTASLRCQIKRYAPIPESILQIALGQSYIQSLPLTLLSEYCLRHNPNYKYTMVTDTEAEEFLQKEFPQYNSLYKSLTRPQYKSDLLRYLWLYKNGGYYIDIDILPILPLWTIYEKTENADSFFAIGAYTKLQKGPLEISNGFIASAPNNPMFLELVKAMEAEPNPSDYGENVKRLWKHIAKSHSMSLYKNENSIYLFKEHEIERGKFCVIHKEEVIAIGNGHGYPPPRT
jgi:hypothetical protein